MIPIVLPSVVWVLHRSNWNTPVLVVFVMSAVPMLANDPSAEAPADLRNCPDVPGEMVCCAPVAVVPAAIKPYAVVAVARPDPPLATGSVPVTPGEMFADPLKLAELVDARLVCTVRDVVSVAALPVVF